MNEEGRGWFATRWARLATGPQMLLILSLGLLPLGLVAIAASIYSAQENSQQRAEQTLERLEAKAEILNELLARTIGMMRASSAAVAAAPENSPGCERVLTRLTSLQMAPGRYAFYGPEGALRCATPGFVPVIRSDGGPSHQSIRVGREVLRLSLFSDEGTIEGVAEFPRQSLTDVTLLPGTRQDFDLELSGGGGFMVLRDDYQPVPFVESVTDIAPIADGRLELRIRLGSAPVRAIDVALILLPMMMWIAAAIIGWWIVNRQLLRPLSKIQDIVSAYRPGDRPIELPRLRSPAREIGDLGAAFDNATRTVARHEAELEAAVERQTRLVREVHHRVKNNLQVVASLLNLHSRGSTSPEAAAAYASIQRRVDALAVVHRNHYAELEENHGVPLKPLISELAANLRATAPQSAAAMQIRLAITPCDVTQDVAVSTAFLITEITEFGMLCGASLVSIALDGEKQGTARLSIHVDSLAGCPDSSLSDRFDRIITGLARQLRSDLEHDPDHGRYAVRIAVLGKNMVA